MIIKSCKQAHVVSTLMDMAFSFDDSTRAEFVSALSIISHSLQKFSNDMKSEEVFGEELSQILTVS